MGNLDYIECAGVRVPADWTVEELSKALAERKIRFNSKNETEIMAVFGNAIELKRVLEVRLNEAQNALVKWERFVLEKRALATCPKCGTSWTEIKPELTKPTTSPSKTKKLTLLPV